MIITFVGAREGGPECLLSSLAYAASLRHLDTYSVEPEDIPEIRLSLPPASCQDASAQQYHADGSSSIRTKRPADSKHSNSVVTEQRLYGDVSGNSHRSIITLNCRLVTSGHRINRHGSCSHRRCATWSILVAEVNTFMPKCEMMNKHESVC